MFDIVTIPTVVGIWPPLGTMPLCFRWLLASRITVQRSFYAERGSTPITKLPGHPLEQHYRRQLACGTKPNLAKLTLARKIAATALAMWKNQEEYDPERHRNA